MKSNGMRALVVGTATGLALTFWTVADMWIDESFFETDQVPFVVRGLVNGAVAGGLILALGGSRLRSTKLAWGLAAAAVVASALFVKLSFFAPGVVLGAAVGLWGAELLSDKAAMSSRLGVGLSLGLVPFVAAGASAIGAQSFTYADVAVRALLLTTVSIAALGMALKSAPPPIAAEPRPMRRAQAPRAAQPLPQGWLWGKLHDRTTGVKALGYLYVDPTAGASFHVLGALDALPSADALERQNYRGDRTIRLGAYETLYVNDALPPELVAFQNQSFEEGGVFGTVVLALSTREKQSLRLPEAPPWAAIYAQAA
jgi:hypothetical protein